jgi:methyltransferase-like protein
MMILAEHWPRGMQFADLCAAARSRLENNPLMVTPDAATAARDAQVLGGDLLQSYSAAVVELHMQALGFVSVVSDRPKANVLARLQAEKGPRVTNLRHETINLDEFNRQLLRHLDGSRDRAALLEVLAGLVSQGVLTIQQQGQAVKEADAVREILSQALDQNLLNLARVALLEG